MVNGARYLDPRTSRWLSTDPALGDYIPRAPIDDEAKKANQNLPGMGGVFNTVNLHLYHYAGNNPVRYTDPTGMFSFDEETETFTADFKDNADMVAALTAKIKYDSENGTSSGLKIQNGEAVELWSANTEDLSNYISATVNGRGGVNLEDVLGAIGFTASSMDAICSIGGIGGSLAGKISITAANLGKLSAAIDFFQMISDPTMNNKLDFVISATGTLGLPGFGLSLIMQGAKTVSPYAAKGAHVLENSILNYIADKAYGIQDFSRIIGR